MTVGQQLQAARKARRLSVDDVATAIRLRAGLVKALESDDLAALGGDVYARGHIRSYARFLELDEAEILAVYAEQIGADSPAVEEVPEPTPAAARSLNLAPVSSLADGAKSLRPRPWRLQGCSNRERVSRLAEAVANMLPTAPCRAVFRRAAACRPSAADFK